jgi:hypothetical protein
MRPVFNFAPGGEIGPLGVKLLPKDEDPLLAPFVLLNIREFSPLRVNEGVNNTLRGQSLPLGKNFTPGGQLKLLKAGLRSRTYFQVVHK